MYKKPYRNEDQYRQSNKKLNDRSFQRFSYQKPQRINYSQINSQKLSFLNTPSKNIQNRQPIIRQQSFYDHRESIIPKNKFQSSRNFYKPKQTLNMNNRVIPKQNKKLFFRKQIKPTKYHINDLVIQKEEAISDENQKLERQFNINNSKIFYGLKTCNGLVRQYNEDRISILLNYQNDRLVQYGLNINYFAIYDGHGGQGCCDFIQNNLHHFIFESEYFPEDIVKAISQGFSKAESEFTRIALSKIPMDRSGSCAVVLIIVNDTGYIANLGDSRIFASEKMKKLIELSRDHKPEYKQEKQRIIDCGGQVVKYLNKKNSNIKNLPYRIYPGGLSVARSFGDIHIKNDEFGGKKGVLSSKPDISVYKITKDTDYFFLGCDGIFDVCQSVQLFREIKYFLKDCRSRKKSLCTKVVNYVIEKTMVRQSTDNLSCIFININNLINS